MPTSLHTTALNENEDNQPAGIINSLLPPWNWSPELIPYRREGRSSEQVKVKLTFIKRSRRVRGHKKEKKNNFCPPKKQQDYERFFSLSTKANVCGAGGCRYKWPFFWFFYIINITIASSPPRSNPPLYCVNLTQFRLPTLDYQQRNYM